MRGANVTMPCKQEVCRNMDKLSDAARFVGAVNTIVNDNGVLTGHICNKGLSVKGRSHSYAGSVNKNVTFSYLIMHKICVT